MKKDFYLDTQFKSYVSEDGDTYISGLASTPDVDRTGDVIEHTAWVKGGLENYKKNPIILFNHSYGKPIGKATEISVSPEGLWIKAKISKAAGEILDLVRDGILSAFSVGFRIKDADYISETDGFRIKDAELFEISVVSVPANQAAVFSLAKSFDSSEEFDTFRKTFVNGLDSSKESVNADATNTAPEEATEVATREINMDQKDLEALVASVAEKTAATIAAAQLEREEQARIAAEAQTKKAAEEQAIAEKISVAVTTGTERLIADIEKRFQQKNEELSTIVSELRSEISEKSEEILKLRESKRIFSDRSDRDWQKAFEKDMDDAFVLSLVSRKQWTDTKFGRDLMEKVNTHSGVTVSSADFEQVVSTSIERDIQNELVLYPLFREIQMNSASMILPVLPDAGYAEFTGNQTGSGTSPNGNLDERSAAYGDYAGVTLTERTLNTKKLISKSYLGNETEEDAILPILPLIRESMIRSHARAVEAAILVGNHAEGPFGTSGVSFNGLIALAAADSDFTTLSGTYDATTSVIDSADLLAARKNMGKYGIRANDVIFIVNQRTYFNLLEDADYQDMNLVGNMATKVTGQVGQIYGSPVILCDEFATPAAEKYGAIAINTRNFVIPRLRGVTVESDYDVENQRRVLVASQRLGFVDLIDGATAKWGIKYPVSA